MPEPQQFCSIRDVYKRQLRMCSEIYHALKALLKEQGYSTAVGDEDVTSLVINPETAPVVKMIFQKYLDGMNITPVSYTHLIHTVQS